MGIVWVPLFIRTSAAVFKVEVNYCSGDFYILEGVHSIH